MNHRTPTTELSHQRVRYMCELILDWCVSKYGVKKNKGVPFLKVTTTDRQTFGEYDDFDHEIFLYYNNCKNVQWIIKTMIHEYTHSIQKGMRSYERLSRENGYWENPLEIEARSMEKEWNLCYGDVIKPYLIGVG